MTVYARIRALRKQKGITSKHVATQLNLTPSGYSMKERGKRPFTVQEIEQVARIIGVAITDFFSEKVNETRTDKTA